MDTFSLLDWWENLRLVWTGVGLCLVLATGVVVWRVRGLLNWKRSQRQELAELRQWRDEAENSRGQALDQVIAACEVIWQSASPDLGMFEDLPAYWRKIAACYYPEEPQPELCLSIGQLLTTAQQLADHLEALMQRPGFGRLGRLRVRQLRRTYDWYRRFNANPAVAWIMARRRSLRIFWHTLRFVLPDPLAWIAYLSQRLTLMMAMRCLMIDVYLFSGKVAVEAFDAQSKSSPETYDSGDDKAVLDAYETQLDEEIRLANAELGALRRDLTGLPARLWNPPGITEWRQAVEKAARLIAADYFPESAAPLEEATCRVLLDRSRHWLNAMADTRRISVVRPLYQISLKRLMQIRAITESDLLRTTGKIASGAWAAWRWARWPVKILRWVRRRSPAGAAIEVGFTLARKALINYLARYGFDRACKELEDVYRLSRAPKNERSTNQENQQDGP